MTGLAAVIAIVGVVAGLMIGCVGVGGVILVPILVYGLDFPIQDAIASAMMGYILTGFVGTAVYAHAKSIRWELAGWIALGAAPGALFGAWALNLVDPRFLEAAVGMISLFAGVNAIVKRSAAAESSGRALRPTELVVVGLLTGALSAITGTGGPLVLVPILMGLKLPALVAVGLSQAAQIPIAILATVGNFAYGQPDVSDGLVLGVALALGTWAGAKVAHGLPRAALERIAAVILVAVGVLILARLLLRTLF